MLVEREVGSEEREHIVEERVRDVAAGNQHLRGGLVRVRLAPTGGLERLPVEVGAAQLVVVDGVDVLAVVLGVGPAREVPGRSCPARSRR